MNKPAWSNSGRTGPARRYQKLLVFACEGLVAVCDERPQYEGEFTVVTPSDMEERINAEARRYRNKTRSELSKWQRQEYDEIISGCQNVKECVKEARAMGDPSDPAVQAWWARHRRSSTIRISLSPGNDAKGYPDLPIVPLGKRTGRTANIEGEAVVPPNVHSKDFPKIHRPARKKSRAGIIEL